MIDDLNNAEILDLESIVADCISIEEIAYNNKGRIIHGALLIEAEQAFEIIQERLKPFNLIPILTQKSQKSEVRGQKTEVRSQIKAALPQVELHLRVLHEVKSVRPWINLILLIATIFTTTLAGTFLAGGNPFKEPKNLILGIPFSLTLLLILSTHELGHYFACKSKGIKATLPYFIPMPPPLFLLGTFGAVIRINSPIPNKSSLIKIGAAGPIAGFIVALPIVIIGIKLSRYELLAALKGGLVLGNSIIFLGLTKLFAPPPPGIGYDLALHPIAFAGWVGMFVTAMNLLPVGQLDGGHINYASLGSRARFVSLPFIAMMTVLSVYWPGWLVWALLIVIFIGIRHPPVLNDISGLSRAEKLMALICLIIFILTFVPIPFSICQ